MAEKKTVVWALLDDRMGSVGQVKGVCAQLDAKKYGVIEKKIAYTRAAALPNLVRGATLLGVDGKSRKGLRPKEAGEGAGPFPDLVISGSRRTAPIARWIKKKSGGKTRIVQLLHPGNGSGIGEFDRVFLPEHDRNKKGRANFVYFVGSPHRVGGASLAEERALWEPEFAHLPRPLTAVIVGGRIKGGEFSAENAIRLGRAIQKFKHKQGGSILITDSRRTGIDAEKLILEEIGEFPSYRYLWGSSGANPYMGFLACADNIVVTGDSVSMCCEACGTGRPVFVFTGEGWLGRKHYRFVNSLYAGGFAAPLGIDDAFFPAARLNPAADIAREIDRLLL